MQFGDIFKFLFEAHYEDWASDSKNSTKKNTRFSREKLATAVSLFSNETKRAMHTEFSIICRELETSILKCDHKETKVSDKLETCKKCGAARWDKSDDDDMGMWNARKWGPWFI